MVDIGTLSLILLLGMFALLAIGMPLGFASAFLAVVTLMLKFDPSILFGTFGRGPLSVVGQAVYRQMTNYVLISIPLFIFMAALLERSGIARDMYSSLNVWLSRTRGGIAFVTSIMAVIMAAMSGIIGGEVVLLGLIALPQMLRLGYDRNLAIGTICASGSLGTMIPPSIVLIFYGLVTETSIKALFTASFLPGFMLATFFLLYIFVRTRLNPALAPLPAPVPGEPEGREKGLMFLGFLSRFIAWLAGVLFIRALFFTLTGENAVRTGEDPIPLGMASDIPWIIGTFILALILIFFVVGRDRTAKGWQMGKGLLAPIIVIGVVLGSIYGGITGITEAAGMGVVAVFVISTLRGEMTFDINGYHLADDVRLSDHGHVYGLGRYRPVDHAGIPAHCRTTAGRRNRVFRVGGRALYSNLVRGRVLYEHASQLLVSAVRTCCILSEIRRTARNLAYGYLQGFSAIHCLATFGPVGVVDLATYRDIVSVTVPIPFKSLEKPMLCSAYDVCRPFLKTGG